MLDRDRLPIPVFLGFPHGSWLMVHGSAEKAMAPHSSTLARKIPWREEPSRLQSMGSLESDMRKRLHFHFSLSFIGRKWQPTPVFLPGEYRPWDQKESEMTKQLSRSFFTTGTKGRGFISKIWGVLFCFPGQMPVS